MSKQTKSTVYFQNTRYQVHVACKSGVPFCFIQEKGWFLLAPLTQSNVYKVVACLEQQRLFEGELQ